MLVFYAFDRLSIILSEVEMIMAIYTRKGDKGKTTLYGCNQSISKSSAIAEALGALDEINSFLGFCKVRSAKAKLTVGKQKCSEIIHNLQETLFIIQAEVAGFPMNVDGKKVKDIEATIAAIEKLLPPIKTFFISGGSELAASFDYARTIARRAERRVVGVSEEDKIKIGEQTLAYLNRL